MRCGQPLRLETPAMPVGPQTAVQPRNNNAIIAAIIALLIILILLLLWFLNGQKLLQVQGVGPTAPLQVAKAMPDKAKMPQDVWDYLEHVRRIEEKKNELSIKQAADMKTFEVMLNTLGPGIGELDPYDQSGQGVPSGDANESKEPADVTKGKFENLRPQWEDLVKDFESKQPPAECQGLHDDYFAALNEIPGMITDLEDLLNQVATNPQAALVKAQGLQSTSYKTIDKNFIQADGRVQGLCDKYEMKKWFNIGDRGGVFAKPGF